MVAAGALILVGAIAWFVRRFERLNAGPLAWEDDYMSLTYTHKLRNEINVWGE